jgi:hypothetical protein
MDRISGGWYSALRKGFAIRGYRWCGSWEAVARKEGNEGRLKYGLASDLK